LQTKFSVVMAATTKRICLFRFSDQVWAGELPAELRYVVFDSAVNSMPN
jgi:hypothetical protein